MTGGGEVSKPRFKGPCETECQARIEMINHCWFALRRGKCDAHLSNVCLFECPVDLPGPNYSEFFQTSLAYMLVFVEGLADGQLGGLSS